MIPRLLTSHLSRRVLVHVSCTNHCRSIGLAAPRLGGLKQKKDQLPLISSGDRHERKQDKHWDNFRQSGHRSGSRNMLLGGFIASVASSLGIETEEKLDEDPMVDAIKKGIFFLDRGLHEEAEKSLHQALQLAQSTANEKAVDYIYVIMADNAMAARELGKAESLYKEVLRRILAKDAKEDDESVIEISLQLATIYAERKEYENAEEGFAYCIQKQKQRIKDINMDKEFSEDQRNSLALYGMILDWFAKYCQLREDYKLALKYTTEAFQLSQKVLGEVHEQTLVLMSDMGVLTEKTGDLDKAIEILKKVVELGSSVNSEALDTFFYNLGMCFIQKRDGDNANYCCVRALKRADEFNHNRALHTKARNCLKMSRELMLETKLGQKP